MNSKSRASGGIRQRSRTARVLAGSCPCPRGGLPKWQVPPFGVCGLPPLFTKLCGIDGVEARERPWAASALLESGGKPPHSKLPPQVRCPSRVISVRAPSNRHVGRFPRRNRAGRACVIIGESVGFHPTPRQSVPIVLHFRQFRILCTTIGIALLACRVQAHAAETGKAEPAKNTEATVVSPAAVCAAFALADAAGEKHSPAEWQGKKAVLIFFIARTAR